MRLARCLFQEVWIKDKEVVAVKPHPELKPFFDLNYEAMQEKLSQDFGKWRPRRDSESLLPENIYTGLYPLFLAPQINSRHKLPLYLWGELAERHKTESLRQLGKEHGVSHESLRRALASAKNNTSASNSITKRR